MNLNAFKNTDKELYREHTDKIDEEAYMPNVFVTEQGAIGMCSGGRCIVKPITEWVNALWDKEEKIRKLGEMIMRVNEEMHNL